MRIFDSHLHIIDPAFPLIPNQGYLPDAFTVSDYQEATADLDVRGGAVVSGSFQGFDQTYLRDALPRLGGGFVGVTQLPADVSDDEVRSLHGVGVRAVRFNLYRGGSETLEHLEDLARRVFDLAGWHTELYLDTRSLPDLEDRLAALPRISIDHLGMSDAEQPALLRLVEGGTRVKATGFGRVDLDITAALRTIHAVNPAALLFGTDLPGTRARRPFQRSDLDLVGEALGSEASQAVLHDNAAAFYGTPRDGGAGEAQGRAGDRRVLGYDVDNIGSYACREDL